MRTGQQKSGGNVPPAQPFRDMNQAIALLKAMHNFTLKKTVSGYEVQIRQAGKRVSATGTDLMATIQRAFGKLRGEGLDVPKRHQSGPVLRLAGNSEGDHP